MQPTNEYLIKRNKFVTKTAPSSFATIGAYVLLRLWFNELGKHTWAGTLEQWAAILNSRPKEPFVTGKYSEDLSKIYGILKALGRDGLCNVFAKEGENGSIVVEDVELKEMAKKQEKTRKRVERHRKRYTDVTKEKEAKRKVGCCLCIYYYYLEVFKKKTNQYRLTYARKNKILARLKDSTPTEIATAIRACKASPFHMGDNQNQKQYNDIALHILKSREKVEWWCDNYKPSKPQTATIRDTIPKWMRERMIGE